MLNLILETTTGRFVPSGVAPQIPRGATAVTLQLVTNGVATLLPDGQPVSLAIYAPGNTEDALAVFAAWTRNTAFNLYAAQIDPLTTGLAWTQLTTLLAQISYGDPTVDSQFNHVILGGAGSGSGGAVPQIVISQPAGPVNYTETIGTFAGKAVVAQDEGYLRVKAAGSILGLQLNAQDAPTGASLLVDVVKNGVPQNKIATLAAAAKAQETIFGAPLAIAIGDIIKFRPTQVGSGKPGTNLSVKAIVQLT